MIYNKMLQEIEEFLYDGCDDYPALFNFIQEYDVKIARCVECDVIGPMWRDIWLVHIENRGLHKVLCYWCDNYDIFTCVECGRTYSYEKLPEEEKMESVGLDCDANICESCFEVKYAVALKGCKV
jgi:hypothetical protein